MGEQPGAVAAQFAQLLDSRCTGRPTGREVRPWMDRIRAEQQEVAA